MHFPYRRLHQPKAGLRNRNSNFRLWLETSEVFDSRSGSNIQKRLATNTKWFGQLKTEKLCFICTFVLLHQHRWSVTKWCVWWIVEHVQKIGEAPIYTEGSMAVEKIFSRWWPNAFLQGWANSGEISFYQLETKRLTFFSTKKFIGKY